MHKRQVVVFVSDLIQSVLTDLKVDWCDEDELLILVLEFLSVRSGGITGTQLAQLFAFNRLMEIFRGIVDAKGITEPILRTFDVETLNALSSFGRKSEHFAALIVAVNELRPTVFQRLSNANQTVRVILSQMLPAAPVQSSQESGDPAVLLDNLGLILFTQDERARKVIFNVLRRLLVAPDDGNIMRIALVSHVRELIEHIRDGDEENCDLLMCSTRSAKAHRE
jgi:hypothetical protein